MRAVSWRRRRRGQALMELALVAPFILMLLVGGAQVGVIAYGNVTMDTAVREGARMASERPANATSFSGTWKTFTGCLAADTNANYTVQAVCNNAGILDTSKVTVTITKNIDVTALLPRPSLHLAGTCAAGYKVLTGTVYNIPAGSTATLKTDADTSVSVSIPSTSPAYSVCLPTQLQTVSVNVGSGCTGYTASASVDVQNKTTQDFTLAANPTCPTLTSTTTTLSASPTSTQTGQAVTLSANVVPATGSPPSGTVTFSDTTGSGTVSLGTATLDPNGVGTLTVSTLAAGSHSISAAYGGDSTHSTSTSAGVTVTVSTAASPTTTTLSVSPASVTQGQTVTLTATVAGAGSTTPTGTVTFTDTVNGVTTTLGTATLSSGVATLTKSTLTAGTHSIGASYGGDTTNAASSTSSTKTVVVSSSSGSGGQPTPGAYACTDPPSGLTTMYIRIDITYPVPIFVPFIGGLFANGSGNTHTVTESQLIKIEPCTLTQGQ